MYVVGRYAPWLGHRSDVDVGCSNIGLLSAKTLENGDKGLKLGPAWLWKKSRRVPGALTTVSMEGTWAAAFVTAPMIAPAASLATAKKLSSRLDPHKKSILEPQR